MPRDHFCLVWLAIACLVILPTCVTPVVSAGSGKDEQLKAPGAEATAALEQDVTQGALRIVRKDGTIVECPLKHTDVQAEVAGFIARVNVTQTFQNPLQEPIEATYVFPLPHQAAVDSMTMVVGQRKIVGIIKRRDEARLIYEQALMQGQTAALLEQERPNIFTQSVGNIVPGQEVEIHISYVDVLKYDLQQYEFYFPMVVGPRFIPGSPSGSTPATPPELQGNVSPPVAHTDRVPDAQRISPPVLRPNTRNGHDISLSLTIDSGVPVRDFEVANHQADIQRQGNSRAVVKLSPADSLPNKDFVVRYDVVGTKPEMALLAHTGDYSGDASKLGNGYFMLMIQPKEDERLKKSPPREIVFLVDVSGSMRGDKTQKTREAMQQMLGLCRDKDTVQVITFASQAQKLFERPLPVNENNIQRALNFTSGLRGSGGTRMLQGVKLAIDEPIDNERIRIVVMLTDGFIGNEAEIIEHVGKHCGDQARFWTVGIGQSPNMFLIDGVARQGGGMGKRLGLNDPSEPLTTEIMTRIQRAQLANIKIDWGDAQVAETYPTRIPELWAGRPVIIYGRFANGGQSRIQVSGTIEGEPVTWPLAIDLPQSQSGHDVLAKIWARQKIEDLMQQSYYVGSPAVEEEVTAIALDYRLMSQYTSFVAVDESQAEATRPVGRPPRQMLVPVPLPEGAQWEGFFGGEKEEADGLALGRSYSRRSDFSAMPAAGAPAMGMGMGGGMYGGAVAGTTMSGANNWAYRPGRSSLDARARTQPIGLGQQPAATARFEFKANLAPASPGLGKALHPIPALLSDGIQLSELDVKVVRGLRSSGAVSESLHGPNSQASLAILYQQAEETFSLAQAAWASLQELKQQGKMDEAQTALLRSLFLDQAAANVGRSRGDIAAAALDALIESHQLQVSAWEKEFPVLSNRLDFVLRDQTIAEALKQVGEAANVTIQLIPGSVKDAQQLTGSSVRVTYLDLRGATVSQALDWILQPVRLAWRVAEGQVLAGSHRRMAGTSAWVYDVARIATPSREELGDQKDPNKIMEIAKNGNEEFLRVARGAVGLRDDESLVWYSPGQLLLIGSKKLHQDAAKLFRELSDPSRNGALDGAAGDLQRVTLQRAEAWKETADKLTAARHLSRIAQTHAAFGWQLLAGAARGQLDDEAATELDIAWNDPASRQLLEGQGRTLVLRSLWILVQASRALPGESRLTDLSKIALEKCKPLINESLDAVEKDPSDIHALRGLLFASLALPGEKTLGASCLAVLRQAAGKNDSHKLEMGIVELLVASGRKLDVARAGVSLNEIADEDMAVLYALACYQAGGEAWQAFRAASRDVLNSSRAPGDVVVLINRLEEGRLAL